MAPNAHETALRQLSYLPGLPTTALMPGFRQHLITEDASLWGDVLMTLTTTLWGAPTRGSALLDLGLKTDCYALSSSYHYDPHAFHE